MSVKGAYTFGPATKCVAGEATFPFPANLVLHLEVGPVTSSEKVTQVPCCFDSEEERDSFRAAVEWAVNAKSRVAAFRSSQGAEKKRRDTETLQRVQSEELEALRLEADVAAMKQRVEEGEAAYRKSSVDRGSLSESLSKEKEGFEALMQRLALEQEAIRAQVALDLEQSRLSADEAAVRVKSLAESNVQTSASVSDMQATLDQKFVDFRKREASNTVLRVRKVEPKKPTTTVDWGKVFNKPPPKDGPIKRDVHGNIEGAEFDLSPDGAFRGIKIAVYQAFVCGGFMLEEFKQALEKKGFELVLWQGALPSLEEFCNTLDQCSQLWLISSHQVTMSEGYIQAVLEFVETPQLEGQSDMNKGLFIMGDNDPFNADANVILQRLPFFNNSVRLLGNFMGDKILKPHPVPTDMRASGHSGFRPHFITTGIETLDEGDTIADVRDPLRLCEPIVTSSDRRSHVTSLYHSSTHRILINGGFTCLMSDRWVQSAGTSRFITNVACFLANPFAAKGE